MRGLIFALLLSIAALPFPQGAARAADNRVFEETEVKAAFVYNLLKFVEWPPETLAAEGPVHLCYAGIPAMQAGALRKLEGKMVQGRVLQVLPAHREAALKGCHAVMLGGGMATLAAQYPAEHGLLTIGEEDFIDQGGMVGLISVGEKVTLEFNLDSLRQAKLRIPSNILGLGRRVKGLAGR